MRRFAHGDALLDAGIGTGRVGLALLRPGLRLTGVDASPAMIERCAADPRAAAVRLVAADFAALPFAAHSFDSVVSADAFIHAADPAAVLDELLRVTRPGGRLIVDLGSADHLAAVAAQRGCAAADASNSEPAGSDSPLVYRTSAELAVLARERRISLIALVPYGAALGSLVPNAWLGASYAARSGGIDRLVSWIGADPQLYAFAAFVERRIAAHAPAAACGRMYAVFENRPDAAAYREPSAADVASADERGAAAWHAEFAGHLAHEPCRAFAVALLAAAWPVTLPIALRALLPEALRFDLDVRERGEAIDAACAAQVDAWRAGAAELRFHGVDLAAVFVPSLLRELRDHSEAAG